MLSEWLCLPKEDNSNWQRIISRTKPSSDLYKIIRWNQTIDETKDDIENISKHLDTLSVTIETQTNDLIEKNEIFEQKKIHLNVKHFGAKGDGITDDTKSIKNAFLELQNNQGNGTLFFPHGTYKITQGFGTDPQNVQEFMNNIIIEGDRATILVDHDNLIGSVRIFTLEGNNITVRGFHFESTLELDLFDTDPVTYYTKGIIGLEIGGKAALYNGITDHIDYYKEKVLVENCSFKWIHSPIICTQTSHGMIRNNNIFGYLSTAIVLWTCPENIQVLNNHIDLGADDGIALGFFPFTGSLFVEPSAWSVAERYSGGHQVIGNYISRTRGKCIKVGGLSDILISKNICELSLNSSIVIEGDPIYHRSGVKNIQIIGNIIKYGGRFYDIESKHEYYRGPVDTENHAISMFRSPATRGDPNNPLPQNILIDSNIVENPSGNGIEVGFADTITILNNIVITGTYNQSSDPLNETFVETMGNAFRTRDVTDTRICDNIVLETANVLWLYIYFIENVNVLKNDIHIKNNTIPPNNNNIFHESGVTLLSGLLDHDMIQGNHYSFMKSFNPPTIEETEYNQSLMKIGTSGESVTMEIKRCPWGTPNSLEAAMFVRNHTTTNRSINLSGEYHASGSDYAEYMIKSNPNIEYKKGDILGINEFGRLTNIFDDSKHFVIKSTEPGIVGNDIWHLLENELLTGDEENKNLSNKEKLQLLRKWVDRIAFVGQVPINYQDEKENIKEGYFVIPIKNQQTGLIDISFISPNDLTFDQFKKSVGKIIKFENHSRQPIVMVKMV